MIGIRENERLYLTSWEYNAAKVLTELAKMVIEKGGRVAPTYKAVISNRNLDDEKRHYRDDIVHLAELEKRSHKEIRANAIEEYKERLEKLESINNDPITVTHISSIYFILDGFIYYYQVNDNPFFDFHYTKTVVKDGKFSKYVYGVEDKKEWFSDRFLYYTCTDSEMMQAASYILDMLVSSKPSPVYRNKERKRVPNAYDGGYHYETVYEPERIEKVIF